MIIKAKRIPKPEVTISREDLLARFCYHFPQYTYSVAEKMPYRRIVRMLKVAGKEEARIMYQLIQIAAAPHTKNGEGIKALSSHYQAILNG